jgi:hypothetical protein
MEKLDRVKVKDGFRLSLKPVKRKIPRHSEHIMYTNPIEGVEDRFDLVPIFVLAGKMNDGFNTHPANFYPYHVGGQGGVPARIIRNGESMNESSPGGLLGKSQHAFLGFPTGASSWNQFNGIDKPIALFDGFLKTIQRNLTPPWSFLS